MAQAKTRPSLHGGLGGHEHDEAVRPGDRPGAALGSGVPDRPGRHRRRDARESARFRRYSEARRAAGSSMLAITRSKPGVSWRGATGRAACDEVAPLCGPGGGSEIPPRSDYGARSRCDLPGALTESTLAARATGAEEAFQNDYPRK